MQNNLKLPTQVKPSSPVIPDKWKPRFVIKRIGDEDIVIPPETRDVILKALQAGMKYVQVGEYTLMLNAIKSIDPFWGANNIPPRPEPRRFVKDYNAEKEKLEYYNDNQAELDEWDATFKNTQLAVDEWASK